MVELEGSQKIIKKEELRKLTSLLIVYKPKGLALRLGHVVLIRNNLPKNWQ